MKKISDDQYLVDEIDLPEVLNCRNANTTKRDYGHALLIAGSLGKMGAAVLAAKACLRSGAGLLTVHIPACGMEVMQTAVPEAMVTIDDHDYFSGTLPQHLERYSAIAIGPGIGTQRRTIRLVCKLLKAINKISDQRPQLIVDADALNIIAKHNDAMLPLLPPTTILTPHDGEYQRLFGQRTPCEVAVSQRITLVKKQHQTLIVNQKGVSFINTTGNAGMSTAGAGDVLTGILLGLTAQRIPPVAASILGVYLHGRAADRAVESQSQASLIASDIIEQLKYVTM